MLCKLFLGFLALVPTIIFLGPPDRWASYLIPMTDPSLMTPPGKSLCLVTGASSGIGRDAVLALARAGFHVVAGVRNVADAEQFRENQKISHVVLDVTSDDNVKSAIENTINIAKRKGLRFTGLVNGAGVPGVFGEPIEWKPLESIRNTMEVNFFGSVRVTKAALPELRRNHGRIIALSGITGKLSPPAMGDYSASKAAVNSFFSTLRRELYEAKVSVSIIQAGCVKSPIWDKVRSNFPVLRERNKTENETYVAYRYFLDPWSESDVGGLCGVLAQYPNMSTSPAIVHAMTSRYPQTHYSPGTFYDDAVRQIYFLAWLLPDRFMDWYVHDLTDHVMRVRFPWWFLRK